ncbi:MAG: aminotransferase class V-fold PLP-dependent enzyme [Actinomycetota bacterium]|nr:aminotransferase class V-fold PLP-dependent enzyme [Actinomycetota bacterium]
MELAAVRNLWEPESIYLNTASYGLPPRSAFDELTSVLADWRAGRTSWEPWGEAAEASRTSFARLVGASPSDVTIGATVSNFVGLIANSLPDGARVLAPNVEFTSNLFPYFTQAERDVTVETVPAARLADAVDSTTTAVAFSTVQSSTGEVADSEAIARAAAAHGALTIVDATQSCGWLPLEATRFDFVVVHTYKWLMSPRGAAFLYVSPDHRDDVSPLAAGWYAGEDVHASYYGPPLRLASSARRFDVSPAWFSWVGARPALELVEDIGVDAINEHNVGLANRFRIALGNEPSNSAIVSVDVAGDMMPLERAGILAAWRAGNLRVSFHLYNDEADVDALLNALEA